MNRLSLIVFLVLALMPPVFAQELTESDQDLTKGQPQDVTDFIHRESECAYWSGEDAYDAARAKQLEAAQKNLKCDALDSDEASLRKKYVKQPKVAKGLTEARTALYEQ